MAVAALKPAELWNAAAVGAVLHGLMAVAALKLFKQSEVIRVAPVGCSPRSHGRGRIEARSRANALPSLTMFSTVSWPWPH